MFEAPTTTIKPTGTLAHETTTAGNTVRFRNGLTAAVYRDGEEGEPFTTYRVFVADRFVAGWRTLAQATTCADRW